ncbi:uncharacterized protein JN550_001959 [Neoarthrinium moseri]|uniref:uncharacterized protein n=1 Tax=Neoarthrinium moseri TaxID=1658444 RepID=UPI001FDC77AA|nr:uncharacterized protein JN550_001959 [Neoarthrinium moseri]KAI1875673.1 hypothetical protein JN550_001959 [Neoarthrinium moseri]
MSAPMFTVANGRLAAEVTKAGGLGLLAAGLDPSAESPHLAALDEQLTIARELLGHGSSSNIALPVGIGFITLLGSTELFHNNSVPIITKHKPALVWLFGSDPSEPLYGELISLLHSVGGSWGLKICVQVGSVDAARQVVRAGADAVVAQGADAGGHLWAKAASLMTLLPEIVDMLRREFKDRQVAVVAAGGIVDGRGVAAALALGADAVTMGTRFITSPETDTAPYARKAVLAAQDGGVATTASSHHDAIQGYPTWSRTYTARAITHQGIVDLEHGNSVENVAASFNEAKQQGDESRLVTFAGTGVGLVKAPKPAAEIVDEVRSEALQLFNTISARHG